MTNFEYNHKKFRQKINSKIAQKSFVKIWENLGENKKKFFELKVKFSFEKFE